MRRRQAQTHLWGRSLSAAVPAFCPGLSIPDSTAHDSALLVDECMPRQSPPFNSPCFSTGDPPSLIPLSVVFVMFLIARLADVRFSRNNDGPIRVPSISPAVAAVVSFCSEKQTVDDPLGGFISFSPPLSPRFLLLPKNHVIIVLVWVFGLFVTSISSVGFLPKMVR